jgi:phosphatidate cytidylyltransferase
MDPASPSASSPPAASRNNLFLRIASAAVLAPLALGTAYVGSWPFALFWCAAAIVVLWEWSRFVCGAGRRAAFATSAVALATAAILLMVVGMTRLGIAVLIVLLGAIAAAALASSERRLWCASGVLYAGVVLIAPIVLRSDAQLGFVAVLFLFAVVWTTDIVAYFAGRAIGGAKLAPAISPNKTWSGAIAGALAAAAVGVAVVRFGGTGSPLPIAVVALMLSVVSQGGDLFESAVKRRFGVKNASELIPGHGGLMDRLDGFLAAACAGALFGLLRGGIDAPARGLIGW